MAIKRSNVCQCAYLMRQRIPKSWCGDLKGSIAYNVTLVLKDGNASVLLMAKV